MNTTTNKEPTMTTNETLTEKQIRALRTEAMSAGDYALMDLAQRALVADDDTIDDDGNEIACADVSQADARAAVVTAIRNAEAQS